jgi:hypothetical protein
MLELSKREFSLLLLLAVQNYTPKVAKWLLLECKEDIEMFGFEETLKKWSKFVGLY